MITQERFTEIVEMLNNAKCTRDNEIFDLIPNKIKLTGNNSGDYEHFLKVCENIPKVMDGFIPDPVAEFYNELIIEKPGENGSLNEAPFVENKKSVQTNKMTGSSDYVRQLFADGIGKENARAEAIKRYPILAKGPHFENRWKAAEKRSQVKK